jgi:hypothetical protein
VHRAGRRACEHPSRAAGPQRQVAGQPLRQATSRPGGQGSPATSRLPASSSPTRITPHPDLHPRPPASARPASSTRIPRPHPASSTRAQNPRSGPHAALPHSRPRPAPAPRSHTYALRPVPHAALPRPALPLPTPPRRSRILRPTRHAPRPMPRSRILPPTPRPHRGPRAPRRALAPAPRTALSSRASTQHAPAPSTRTRARTQGSTPNAQRPTPNAQRPTPNAQRPTPNAREFEPSPSGRAVSLLRHFARLLSYCIETICADHLECRWTPAGELTPRQAHRGPNQHHSHSRPSRCGPGAPWPAIRHRLQSASASAGEPGGGLRLGGRHSEGRPALREARKRYIV